MLTDSSSALHTTSTAFLLTPPKDSLKFNYNLHYSE